MIWKNTLDAANMEIQGQRLSLEAGNKGLLGNNFLLSSQGGGVKSSPALIFGKETDCGLVIWNYTQAYSSVNDVVLQPIDSRYVFPLPFGLNNFFTAPLIERDYEVRARIKF